MVAQLLTSVQRGCGVEKEVGLGLAAMRIAKSTNHPLQST
jgi:hypothetical protein